MRKEILDALRAKFPGISDAILGRVADKLSRTATTAEQVATAVEGVTIQQVIDSYGDSRATEAQQKAVHTYESKYGLKDGQKIDNGGAAGGQAGGGTTVIQQPTGGANDQTNALLQQLIDQNKALTDRLNKMDGQRTTETRKQQLSTIIEKLPENLRKAYERTPVDNLTDEQFNTLVGEITTEVNGIVSETQAKGAVFGRPASQSGTGNQGDALTKEQLDAIAHRDSKPVDGQPF